jgi:A/G-specific adenine glycosylase
MWELPGAMVGAGESAQAACVRGIREATGVAATLRKELGDLDHAYSHFRITLHVLEGIAPRGRVRARTDPGPGEAARFVPVGELSELPFARAHRRALELFLET